MNNQRVNQQKIQAGGDVAGGDIDKSLNITQTSPRKSPLSNLAAEYVKELVSGESISEIIEKLQHWHKEADSTSTVLGVRAKLERGNREDLVNFAIQAKELFTKCLARHQHSKAAQEICAYLLGWIWQKFGQTIHPRITEGRSNAAIDELIQINLINPLEEILESNPLRLDPSELSGMIYFLTGNCHLNWD